MGVSNDNDTQELSTLWNEANKKRHVVSWPRRVVMKRRRVIRRASSTNNNNKIVRKVRTLKSLIPQSESQGLDGLFTDTADYILSLQMRVRVMQIMVKVLSGSEE